MAALGGVSTGYGSLSLRHRLYFDGDEQHYEAWEEKFLGYLLVKDLKKTVLAAENENIDNDKNELAYAEMIQFLDSTSHQLVMRDAKDDGRKALSILRTHYSGKEKSRVLSMYTEHVIVKITIRNCNRLHIESRKISFGSEKCWREY